jgi:hypothetical protein
MWSVGDSVRAFLAGSSEVSLGLPGRKSIYIRDAAAHRDAVRVAQRKDPGTTEQTTAAHAMRWGRVETADQPLFRQNLQHSMAPLW